MSSTTGSIGESKKSQKRARAASEKGGHLRSPLVNDNASPDCGWSGPGCEETAKNQAPQADACKTLPRPCRQLLAVKRGEASRRIHALASISDALDVRNQLRRLARQVASGPRNVQGISMIEAAISEALDEAALATIARQQWLLCEAATWGLAWLARTRRAGGSAGGLLERLVKMARIAKPMLEARDTLPARFVLTLARLFADIEACRCLEAGVKDALEKEIQWLVSAAGGVALSGSSAILERVNRWAVALEIADFTGMPVWNDATQQRFVLALSGALRLLASHGRILVGAGKLPIAFSESLLRALSFSGDKTLKRTANSLKNQTRSIRASKKTKMQRKTKSLTSANLLSRDLNDATTGVAIIRSGWKRSSLRILLEYRESTPRLEIACGDRLLVEGPWQWRASLNGETLEAEGPWEVSCFESDKKATFLEIIAPLGRGLQIERQIVMIPDDQIVLLADTLTAQPGDVHAVDLARTTAGEGSLLYENAVSLSSTLDTEQADETREITVYDTQMRFVAIPLALPEWKVAGCRGEFSPRLLPHSQQAIESLSGNARLILRQETFARRLYAPLWLDCNPDRIGEPLTWRQLHVADTRSNLPPHQAVGFRVQSGPEQWLLYRSLDAPRNRTLLGCNLSCEFMLGQIRPAGTIARAIEIQ